MQVSSHSWCEEPINTFHHFAHFPPELIVRILEIAAGDYHQAALSISSVSTWARKIALPHIFSTVVYRFRPAFTHAMSSRARDPPSPRLLRPFGHFVRNLWLDSKGISNASNEEELFRTCTNVENLAVMSQSLRAFSIQAQKTARRAVVDNGSLSSLNTFRLKSITLLTHTSRYDWHFLAGLHARDGSELLKNVTSLRILDMVISSFSPHNLLPNLTYLALPYLDLGNDFKQNILRLPSGVLEHQTLRMIVLTVAEDKWLNNPWYQIAKYPQETNTSPKAMFQLLVRWAREKDERIHVILSPRIGDDPCKEWVTAARAGQAIWEVAARLRSDDEHDIGLPDTFPKDMYSYT